MTNKDFNLMSESDWNLYKMLLLRIQKNKDKAKKKRHLSLLEAVHDLTFRAWALQQKPFWDIDDVDDYRAIVLELKRLEQELVRLRSTNVYRLN
jgi:uncharacterized membrane protein